MTLFAKKKFANKLNIVLIASKPGCFDQFDVNKTKDNRVVEIVATKKNKSGSSKD